MKLKSIIAATAAVVFAGNVAAQATSGSGLTADTAGAYLGALPVGIVANPALRNALQAAQLDAVCVGNDSKTCMPSISTIELTSIMQGTFGQEWGAYGITAFGTGALANAVVCGTLTGGDQATLVAARHIGMGCNTANPEGLFNTIAGGVFALPQHNVSACLGAGEGASAGGIGFAGADIQDANFRFLKLDGQSPDLANFNAGNYAMFGDIHGGSLTGNTTAQPFGDTGAVPAANNPPFHSAGGSTTTSTACGAGRNFGTGDLVN